MLLTCLWWCWCKQTYCAANGQLYESIAHTLCISMFICFLSYILLIILVQLSCFFPPLHPERSSPHSLRPSPHHCSGPWVMYVSFLTFPFPILYFTPPWLFCNYLFALLNPLTSSSIPLHPIPSDKHQNILNIHDSVSVLLVCLVWFCRFNCWQICIFAILCSYFWSFS